MYLVVNTLKRKLFISDLDIEIGPNQMIDLDKYKKTNLSPEYSKDLNKAKLAGIVKIMKTDRSELPAPERQEVSTSEDALQSIINKAVASALEASKAQQPEAKSDSSNSEILNALNNLNEKIANGSVASASSGSDNDEDLDGMDEDLLSSIHAKSLDKIKSNTSGSLEYEKEEVQDDSIQGNISDLMDLDI